MDGRFNILTQSLFQKSLDDSSLEEIQSFIKQYPYFAPAQFLLLKRLNPSSEEYKNQYQKALLFHHDPLSLNQLLNDQADDESLWAQHLETLLEPAEEPKREEINPDSDVVVETEPPVVEAIEEENRIEETPDIGEPVPSTMESQIKEEASSLDVVAQSPAPELTFEPFHTVDYFASQGIKLSLEETPKDQLGKQLKSFTEWLKTMKRLPSADLNKSVDKIAERKVEHLAEDSVQNSEVVTEAMAEVWAHQGNHPKAIEIYNKLSLLNPSKRAYFASKIDSLKKSI